MAAGLESYGLAWELVWVVFVVDGVEWTHAYVAFIFWVGRLDGFCFIWS